MPTGNKIMRTTEGRSRCLLPAFSFFRPRRKGQAMTEMLLLLPLFMFIVFFTAKIFALLVLVQKLEIASFYAARRWQLESHLSSDYAGDDMGNLKADIKDKVEEYIGYNNPAVAGFLKLAPPLEIEVKPTMVWNEVTLTVRTSGNRVGLLCKYSEMDVCAPPYGKVCQVGYDYICGAGGGKGMTVTKYVPSRDRPIAFELPGLK